MKIKNVENPVSQKSVATEEVPNLVGNPLHPWEKFGLTREQASKKAMDAINRELGSLEASGHLAWNKTIALQMMQGESDPAMLWQTYQKLLKADIAIEEFGKNPYCLHPDDTPPMANPIEKDKSPDFTPN